MHVLITVKEISCILHLYIIIDFGLKGSAPTEQGGQLQIAGVVVGSWGPNRQQNVRPGGSPMRPPLLPPPRIASVGPRR